MWVNTGSKITKKTPEQSQNCYFLPDSHTYECVSGVRKVNSDNVLMSSLFSLNRHLPTGK